MSIESAKAFIERMKTDQEFAKKVSECKTAKEAKSFVASQGYDFTEVDLQQKEVISDDDLNCVSGGLSDAVSPPTVGVGESPAEAFARMYQAMVHAFGEAWYK